MTITLFVVALVSQFLLGCYDDRYGFLGISSDAEESHSRGVWVCDYALMDSVLVINSTVRLTIREAYLERIWRYGKTSLSETTINSDDGYWFVIHFDNDANLRDLGFKWSIGPSWGNSFRPASKNSVVLEMKEIPVGDSVSFPIFIGDARRMNGKREKIGEMMLRRKGHVDTR